MQDNIKHGYHEHMKFRWGFDNGQGRPESVWHVDHFDPAHLVDVTELLLALTCVFLFHSDIQVVVNLNLWPPWYPFKSQYRRR